jgi:hypothetical protein
MNFLKQCKYVKEANTSVCDPQTIDDTYMHVSSGLCAVQKLFPGGFKFCDRQNVGKNNKVGERQDSQRELNSCIHSDR